MSSPLSSGPKVVSSGSGIAVLRCTSAQIQALYGTVGEAGQDRTEHGGWVLYLRMPKHPSHQASSNPSGQLIEHVYHFKEVCHRVDLLQKLTGHAPCQGSQSPVGVLVHRCSFSTCTACLLLDINTLKTSTDICLW